ncbi:MAG: hypothetical protein RLZZ242_826 [Bacteroidota bacterium]
MSRPMSKVICIGELLIDFVAEHHSGSIQEAAQFSKKAGGAPANVACAVQRLGQKALFAGAVGKDPFGDFLVRTIGSEGVDLSFVQRLEAFTTLAFVALSEDGERDFYFSRGADAGLIRDPRLIESIDPQDIVHFGSATAFLEGDLNETYQQYLSEAKKRGCLISFDPNFRIDLWRSNKAEFVAQCLSFIASADLCKFSEEEAFLISNQTSFDQAAAFFHRQGARLVCITLGQRGTFISLKGEKALVPSVSANAIDTTAAGDAFVGALLSQLSQHEDRSVLFEQLDRLIPLIAYANRAGAFTTQSYGAMQSLPYAKDLIS